MKTRILIKLDCKPPYVIKPVLFDGVRKMDLIEVLSQKYYEHDPDELVYLDTVSSLYNKSIDFNCINKFANNKFIPLAIGGGIKTEFDIHKLFKNGADKIILNTHLINNPKFITKISENYGSQSIVVNIEAKKIGKKYFCFTESGRNNTRIEVSDWIITLNNLGVGEIFLQSIDCDGLMKGYDEELFELGAKHSKLPLILSGGFSDNNNVLKAIKDFKPSGVSISSGVHYEKINIKDLKANL